MSKANYPVGETFLLTYKTKKREYTFTIHAAITQGGLDQHFARWKEETYLWTPENFGMFLRDRGIRYWIESVSYKNLIR